MKNRMPVAPMATEPTGRLPYVVAEAAETPCNPRWEAFQQLDDAAMTYLRLSAADFIQAEGRDVRAALLDAIDPVICMIREALAEVIAEYPAVTLPAVLAGDRG